MDTISSKQDVSFDDLFSNDVTLAINNWRTPLLSFIDSYSVPSLPDDTIDLLAVKATLESNYSTLQKCTITFPEFDVKASVKTYIDEIDAKVQHAENEFKESAKRAKEAREQEVISYNNEVLSHNSSLTEHMESKHKYLCKYKKKLQPIFKKYNITAASAVLTDNITEEEFDAMLDAAIDTCEKYTNKSEPKINELFKKLTQENGIQGTILLAIGTFLTYCSLCIIAIPSYIYMFKNVSEMTQDTDKLKIARALMAEIDYKRFVAKDKYMQMKSSPDMSDIDETMAFNLSNINRHEDEKAYLTSQAEMYQKQVDERCRQEHDSLVKLLQDKCDAFENALKTCNERLDKFNASYKPFPTVCSTSAAMSHKYVVGRIQNTIDVTAELPLKNIVFKCPGPTERKTAVEHCKLYLCNALLSVKAKQLKVEIYDPLFQCQEFAEFFTDKTASEYISANDKDLFKSIEEYRKLSLANIKAMNHVNIDEYNRNAEETGITTIPYSLLIIASGMEHSTNLQEDRERNKSLYEYIKNSCDNGIMIWIIDYVSYPGTIEVGDNYTLEKGAPIYYTQQLGEEALDTFVEALRNAKDTGIDYTNAFAKRYIPEDKWWTWDTIKGIELNFGLVNGDPNKGDPIVLGDDNVHALMGGATGAGKSATINQMLISLMTKYPPSELHIAFIDFKNVEAAKFTRGMHEDGTYMSREEMEQLNKDNAYYQRYGFAPHLEIISGTTDGGYALSLFKWLNDEMLRRKAIIDAYGKVKIQEVRQMILDRYCKEKGIKKIKWYDMRQDWEWYKPNVLDQGLEIPRLLLICDEFQVMFNEEIVPRKIIDQILGLITNITKLARAMSCHLWFTSQSMKGTMSEDVKGNFSVRAALRCTKEVSNEIIGNSAAGTITQKFGYIYTNDSAGQNPNANIRWRVPYLDADDIPPYIEKMNSLLESHHEQALLPVFYDDKELIPARELNKWYSEYPDQFSNVRTFIIGERAEYSTNKAPINFTLGKDPNENIMISGFDVEDVMQNVMTAIVNIQHKENVSLIFNTRDKNSYNLMNPNSFIDKKFQALASYKQDPSELVSSLATMVTSRKERGNIDNVVYVILLFWERASGVMDGSSYKMEDAMKALLIEGPSVGVHFIFGCREKLQMGRWVTSSCNHKIAAMHGKDVFYFTDNAPADKLPPKSQGEGNFAYYEYGTNCTKFKIYQHTFSGSVEEKEVVIN